MLLLATSIGAITLVGLVTYIVWALFNNYEFDAEMGGTVFQIIVGFLTILIILLWIFFPVFVYHFLGRIARATESSESLLQAISKKMGVSASTNTPENPLLRK